MKMFQVIVAYGTMQIEQLLTQATARAATGQLVLAIVIVRAPSTKSWSLGVSRNGFPLTWVSSHRHVRDAKRQIQEVKQVSHLYDLRDDATFAKLIHELAARSDPSLLASVAVPQVTKSQCLRGGALSRTGA